MSYEDKKSQGKPLGKEDSLGLNREERWQLIQYFNDLIKHGDSKIQMLLTVQGVIVAAYGGFISTFLSKPNIWNPATIFLSALFAVSVVASLLVGIVALQPYVKEHNGEPATREGQGKENIYYYGSYSDSRILDGLDYATTEEKMSYLGAQISVLGGIATRKFRKVFFLEWLVFSNVLILIASFIFFASAGQ
ncbi:Pycsar system effector family protein [Rothia mucilaginosa]|uniref:Pycsar system effector family protein n=1 Tax=Rothia mucilaginosa TaxID=43675 RepID=UPI0028D34D80|nr:Pycsar system effector family protein [Rothia mucilaginosa]